MVGRNHFCKLIVLILLLSVSAFSNQSRALTNRAVKLTGGDNDLRIGMAPIDKNWTVEMWVKRDGTWASSYEMFLGGGSNSKCDGYDRKPMMLMSGKLYNDGADISSPEVLDDQWHHIAARCDGSKTSLFVDGEEVASANTVTSIIPGNIGSFSNNAYDSRTKTFNGLIDEVRIWTTAVSNSDIKSWMGRPVTPSHPNYDKLKGYYPFDNGMEEMSPNVVGIAPYTNHAIFTKCGAKDDSTDPLAYLVESNNNKFNAPSSQEIVTVSAVSCEWDFDLGSKDEAAHSLLITTTGTSNPLTLESITLDMSGVEDMADIDKVHIYYLGDTPISESPVEIGSGQTPANELTFSINQALAEGTNYFLIAYDMSSTALFGNKLDAKISTVTITGKEIIPHQNDSLAVKSQVTESSETNKNILRVMSWNVWHGGRNLGDLYHGQESVVEIIRRSKADVVLMQESYGIQHRVRDSLGFHLYSPSETSNLAIYSRYPIETLEPSFDFKGIGAIATLPNNEKVALFDVWLMYAAFPDYTSSYMNDGHDIAAWLRQDEERNHTDIKKIIANDLNLVPGDMPTIIGGDFNACSHLDWTEKAKVIHNGYGPVPFPTSQTMLKEGFVDSYRELHKDELKFPGGTWAAAFGTVDCRIDFVYGRGEELNPIASKIIRTSDVLHYPWPGDHGAVLTTYHFGEYKVSNEKFIKTGSSSKVQLNSINTKGLSLQIPTTNTYTIEVHNLLGQKLYRTTLNAKAGTIQIPMHLSSGVKIVHISDGVQSSTNKAVVK